MGARRREWGAELKKLLFASRYCWNSPSNTQALELVEDEFYGGPGDMGYADHVRDFIEEKEKAAYLAGFLAGSELVASEHEETVEEAVNQITAERNYLKWR